MRGPVLHLLSQRPGQTGSGVILNALMAQAEPAGWQQLAVVGLPADLPLSELDGLDPDLLRPLRFETERLPFALPGMSDVMPYPSRRFSSLSAAELAIYREAWREHLAEVITEFRPRVIHSHHVWLLSALVKDVAPEIPVLTSCHATGLRQAELCPELAPAVWRSCARNDRFLVLHAAQREQLASVLGIEPARIAVVGAGYREELFHAEGRGEDDRRRLLYIGKFSAAKGLPQLLDAVATMVAKGIEVELHVAGGGGGAEGDALAARMAGLEDWVTVHGQLEQAALSALMRRCAVCVLPSFYEGLPLVLVEAAASGCRLVATDLPGIRAELAPRLGEGLTLVPAPRMTSVDRPAPAALGEFTDALESALTQALAAGPAPSAMRASCADLAWSAVFERIEAHWSDLVAGRSPGNR